MILILLFLLAFSVTSSDFEAVIVDLPEDGEEEGS